jgi:hypothetical protein
MKSELKLSAAKNALATAPLADIPSQTVMKDRCIQDTPSRTVMKDPCIQDTPSRMVMKDLCIHQNPNAVSRLRFAPVAAAAARV